MSIKFTISRHDEMEGVGAYLSPSIKEETGGRIMLNVECLFNDMIDEDGNAVQLEPSDIPDAIIETLMHEFGHALEEYFGKEFNEERIEGIVDKWRNERETNSL